MSFPIRLTKPLQLKLLGIDSKMYSTNVTMESDKFIVYLSPSISTQKIAMFGSEGQKIIIIDLHDKINPIRLPINCDSMIMHPRQKIIATKFGKMLQIIDISKVNSIVKSHDHHESVIFWKWISEGTIGIVSKSSVYHWPLTGLSEPTKILSYSLSGFKIVDYITSEDGQWHLLNGHKKEPNAFRKGSRVPSKLLLYDIQRKVSRLIECPGSAAACFGRFRMKGNCHPSNLLLYHYQGGKLNMIEIGPPGYGNTPYSAKSEAVHDSPIIANDEVPLLIQTSKTHGMAYLVTKFGFVHYFDLESGTRLYSHRFSKEEMFVATKHSECGFIGIDLRGNVLKATLNEQNMIETVAETNTDLAFELVRRWKGNPDPVPNQSDTTVTRAVPSAPCLTLEEFEHEERREVVIPRHPKVPLISRPTIPPRPPIYDIPHTNTSPLHSKVPGNSLPIMPTRIPLYDFPPSDTTTNSSLTSPKFDPIAFAPPPPYSAVEQTDSQVLRNESLSRAERAERERDALAAKCAELERKYQEALSMKERGN